MTRRCAALPIAALLMCLALARPGAAQDPGALNPRWARFTPDNSGLADLRVLDVVEAADGSMWFVHPSAVSRFDARIWQTFPADVALPEDASAPVDAFPTPPWDAFGLTPSPVAHAVTDSRGAVWLATDAGAFRLDPDRWENGIPAYRGMALYEVRDVLRDSYGVLWFAAYDPVSTEGSLSGLDPSGRWLFFNAEVEGLVSNDITALAEDAAGGLWAGSVDRGVSRYLGDAWQSWTAADSPLPDDRVIDLQPADGGRVMAVVTRGGVAGYDIAAETWDVQIPSLDADTPGDYEITAALVTGDAIWFGLHGSANLLSTGDDGLIAVSAPVQGIARRAQDGSLWAVAGDALLHNAPEAEGWRGWAETRLPFAGGSSVMADPAGMLWIGTAEGVARFDPDTEAWVIFNVENSGLAESRAHLTHVDQSRGGLLVFRTDRVYVSTYRPDPPTPRLTLSVDGGPSRPVYAESIVLLPVGTQAATFTISASAWWPTGALTYRVRLDGPEGQTRTLYRAEDLAAHAAEVTLEALPPGAYTLCAQVVSPMLDASPEVCAQFVAP